MKIFAQNFNIESPHYSSIREWLERIGLYELNREKEKLQDWIYVVADNGSNLRKGIKLYQENHQQVIYTYDVTHGMANLLKKDLEIAQDFQDFLADCHRCKQ